LPAAGTAQASGTATHASANMLRTATCQERNQPRERPQDKRSLPATCCPVVTLPSSCTAHYAHSQSPH
jgi:hypothetical protein